MDTADGETTDEQFVETAKKNVAYRPKPSTANQGIGDDSPYRAVYVKGGHEALSFIE